MAGGGAACGVCHLKGALLGSEDRWPQAIRMRFFPEKARFLYDSPWFFKCQ